MMSYDCEIGIAITTMNRKDILIDLIDKIIKYTKSNYRIVVCDDGSTDGTIEYLEKNNISVIGKINKGIAWNKNRGIFYFTNLVRAKYIILMDDDICPYISGWDYEWILACQRVGHINYIPDGGKILSSHSEINASRLGVASWVGGMIIAQSASAILNVGYMDIRYGRYGHEHVDFSIRFLRAGFGGALCKINNELHNRFYVIRSGVLLKEVPSSGSREDYIKNEILLKTLINDPIYRLPWRSDEEMEEFLNEYTDIPRHMENPPVPTANFDSDSYQKKNLDVKESSFDAFTHYVENGFREKREL